MDLCLSVQRLAVQATGRVMANFVLQERSRWLNLTILSDREREREEMLDTPIVPEGISGSALASLQDRVEARRKREEAFRPGLP